MSLDYFIENLIGINEFDFELEDVFENNRMQVFLLYT